MADSSLIGASALKKRLLALANGVAKEAGRALYEEGLVIMKESVRRCPLEFGPLRASATVHPPDVSGRDVSVTLSYGGPSARYALAVHERMGPTNWSEPGTGPKYLEGPVLEAKPKLLGRLAARIDLNKVA